MHLANVSTVKRKGIGMYELIVVLVILVTSGGLMFPTFQKVKKADLRTQSINNLKQIALGVHSFHDANRRLVFNGSDAVVQGVKYTAAADASSTTSGSWAFQLLPYLDENETFQKVDRTKGVKAYLCPGRAGRPPVETSNGGGAWTDYFLNNYLNNAEKASKPDNSDNKRTLVGITDGTSNTIFIGHGNIRTSQYKSKADVTLSSNIFKGGTTGTMRAGDDGQTSPKGVTLQRDSDKAPTVGSWGGPFAEGSLMAMGDATVRVFPYTLKNLGEFLTPNGGEVVTLPR